MAASPLLSRWGVDDDRKLILLKTSCGRNCVAEVLLTLTLQLNELISSLSRLFIIIVISPIIIFYYYFLLFDAIIYYKPLSASLTGTVAAVAVKRWAQWDFRHLHLPRHPSIGCSKSRSGPC